MLKKIFQKINWFLFPIIVRAKYHYDDRLLFVYYSNGKRKIFQGSGVFWTNIETKKRCDNICLIDTLCNIKIQIDKTGKNYVDLTQEII